MKFVAAIFLSFILSFSAFAAELTGDQEKRFKTLTRSLMSPFCAARALSDCPSSGAHDLKREIRGLLASGKSDEEIWENLREKYGNEINAAPEAKGFGLLGWFAPLGFLLCFLGAILLWAKMRREEVAQEVRPEVKDKRIDDLLDE